MDIKSMIEKHKELYVENTTKINVLERMASKAFEDILKFINDYKTIWGKNCPLEVAIENKPYREIKLTFAGQQLIFDFDFANIEHLSNNSLVLRYAILEDDEDDKEKTFFENIAAGREVDGKWFIINDEGRLVDWQVGFNEVMQPIVDNFIKGAIRKMYENYVP